MRGEQGRGHSSDSAGATALAPHGIRVNAVCPGVIDTEFNQRPDWSRGVEQQRLEPGEYLRRVVQSTPLGRMGDPDDVAAVVSFLASQEARFITGQAINVDGGAVFG